jgi:hypothetical protein
MGLYVPAAVLPAYLLARKSASAGRILVAWVAGFSAVVAAALVAFLVAACTNLDAAPLAIAMALVQPLPWLLAAPCAGVAVGQAQRYLGRRR